MFTFLPIAWVYWYHSGVPSGVMLEHLILTFPVNYLAVRWVAPLLVARVAGHGLA